MQVRVFTEGKIVLPAKIRRQDGIATGQVFEVKRLGAGEYLLKRKERRSVGLLRLLLACPIKGWFKSMDRSQTTDDIVVPDLE